MEILRFKCRIENKVTDHECSDEGGSLPPSVVLAKCQSCGVMGIEMRDNEKGVKRADIRL